jgi:two-component system, NarL family, nitrate/nitrite response regulator NarL
MVKILVVDGHKLMRNAVREVLEKEEDFVVAGEASNGAEAAEQAELLQPDVVLMDLDLPDCDGFEATRRVLAHSPQSRIVIFTASREEHHVLQALQHNAMGYITKDVEPEGLVHAIRCAERNDLCIPGALAVHVLAYIRATWHAHNTFAHYRRSTARAVAFQIPDRKSARPFAASLPHPSEETAQPHAPIVTTALDTSITPDDVQGEVVTGETSSTCPLDAADPADPPYTFVAGMGGIPFDAPMLALPMVRPLTEREQEILDLMRKGRKNREIAGELSIAESTVHKHVQNIFEKLNARNRTEAIYFTS